MNSDATFRTEEEEECACVKNDYEFLQSACLTRGKVLERWRQVRLSRVTLVVTRFSVLHPPYRTAVYRELFTQAEREAFLSCKSFQCSLFSSFDSPSTAEIFSHVFLYLSTPTKFDTKQHESFCTFHVSGIPLFTHPWETESVDVHCVAKCCQQ